MAQSLRQHDAWMTEQAFTDLTGIHRKSSITQVKKMFNGVDVNDVFPTLFFNRIDITNLDSMRHVLRLDEYLFVLRLFTIKHLLVDKDMIQLCQSVEKYTLYYHRSRFMQIRTGSSYTDTVEYVTSMMAHTLKYHNVSLCYERVCHNETDNSIKVIRRLMAKRPFADMEALVALNNEIIRRENMWQKRKGIAVFRMGVVIWFKKPKIERQQFKAKQCELVMNNTNNRRHLASFL